MGPYHGVKPIGNADWPFQRMLAMVVRTYSLQRQMSRLQLTTIDDIHVLLPVRRPGKRMSRDINNPMDSGVRKNSDFFPFCTNGCDDHLRIKENKS
jgi:hypothetical protein